MAEVLARVCAEPDLRAGRSQSRSPAPSTRRSATRCRRSPRSSKQRRIRVERLVRVACPARGTLLASKRLDAYLSVFKWTLELAGAPVLPELVDFLGEVAQRRTDPAVIPGLAAQMPDSPLVQWLHAVDEPIAGSLRVIAGDIEGDSVVSWLKTLLADAFYWTDHDLVVQTRSMYGGAPRRDGATFVLRPGRRGLAFQLLHQRAHRRTPSPTRWSQDAPAGLSHHRSAVVGRRIRDRQARRRPRRRARRR